MATSMTSSRCLCSDSKKVVSREGSDRGYGASILVKVGRMMETGGKSGLGIPHGSGKIRLVWNI